MELLNYLDFVSSKPKLMVNSKNRFYNIYGLIFSILFLIIMLGISLVLFMDFYYKKGLRIVFNEQINENPLQNLTNFPFAFNVFYANGKNFENVEKFFKMSAQFFHIDYDKVDKEGNVEIFANSISIKKCKYFENSNSFSLNEFNLKNSESYFCLNTTNKNFTLKGTYGDYSKNLSFFSIKIEKCLNSSENQYSCFTNERIEKELSKAEFSLKLVDNNVNNFHINSPISPYLKSFLFNKIDGKISTYIKLYFTNFNYQVDKGLLFSDISTNCSFQQTGFEKEFSLSNLENTTILNIIFSMSKNKGLYYVSYEKLLSFLANLGALFNVLWCSVIVLNKFIIKKLFYIYICQYNKIIDNKWNPNLFNFNNRYSLRLLKIKKMKVINQFMPQNTTLHSNNNNLKKLKFEKKKIETENVNNLAEVANFGNVVNSLTNINLGNSNVVNIERKKRNNYGDLALLSNININNSEMNLNIYNVKNLRKNTRDDHAYKLTKKIFTKEIEIDKHEIKRKFIGFNPYFLANRVSQSENLNGVKLNKKKKEFKEKSENVQNFYNGISNINQNTSNVNLLVNANHIQNTNFKDPNYLNDLLKSKSDKLADTVSRNKTEKSLLNKSTKRYLKDFASILFKVGNSRKTRLMDKIRGYIYKKISIEEIIRKLIEVDKLKFTLLENEILNNFKNIPGRFFYENESEENNLRINSFNNKNIGNSTYQGITSMDRISDDFKEIKNYWIINEFDDEKNNNFYASNISTKKTNMND